jgi:uncharacterized membrane protein
MSALKFSARILAAGAVLAVCLIGLLWLLAAWVFLAAAGRPVRPWPHD